MRIAGRYELERLLGRGGMAEVWQARHLALDAVVAIKLLHPGVVVDEGLRRRFLAEAQITARLRTRYAVQVFDFGISDDGQPFLAMELLEGETLAGRLQARGKLGPRATATFLSQAARALDRAHALGIVHRDFKPENLFIVSDDDGGEQIKVVDFGIAKLLGGLDAPPAAESSLARALPVAPEGSLAFGTLTRTGARLGTPYYMAPEQVEGAASVGRAADVWALGVVAFECLTGRRPFEGPDVQAVFQHIRTGAYPPPRTLNAALPEAFDEWFARTCARDASRRFTGAGEAAQALRPALALAGEVVELAEDDGARDRAVDAPDAQAAAMAATERLEPTTPVAGAPVAPARGRARTWTVAGVLGGAAALALGVGLAARSHGAPPTDASSAPSALVDAAPPVAPISAEPAATAAYEAGLQAWRDGSSQAALRSMQTAVRLDPGLAGASLRIALWAQLARFVIVGSVGTNAGRAEYAEARNHRGTASNYDRELLDAFEPRFRPEPDLAETERRLASVADRYPGRAEPLYWVATTMGERGDATGAANVIAHAMAVEPEVRPALLALGAWVAGASTDEAATKLDECLAVDPSATDCLGERARLRGLGGRCDAMEADAHAWISADGEDPHAYVALSEALFANGAPVDGLRDAFEAAERHSAADERAIWEVSHKIHLALASGELGPAIASARVFEESLGPSPNITVRFLATWVLADLAEEAGEPGAARRSVLEFVQRAPAWTAASPTENAMVVAMLRYAWRFGAISRGDFERASARALAATEAALPAASQSARWKAWIFAYGWAFETPADAKKALAALDRYAPLAAPEALQSLHAAIVGEVLLAAGDRDRAIPYLRRGATTCFMLNSILDVLRARVTLAGALAEAGQRDEARSLLRSVVARWGHATPRSRTADRARAMLAALGS